MSAPKQACYTTAFIHIDTFLKPSGYQKLIWATTLLCFSVIGSLLPLPLAYKILLGLVVLVSLWFGQIYSHHLLALSSLAANHKGKPQQMAHEKFDFLTWQLQCVRGVVQVPWGHIKGSGQDVWQAMLIEVTDMGCIMILTFNVIEPQQNKLRVSVWQDQVNNDTWRQLKVLAQ